MSCFVDVVQNCVDGEADADVAENPESRRSVERSVTVDQGVIADIVFILMDL
jgi:hypothetical protein